MKKYLLSFIILPILLFGGTHPVKLKEVFKKQINVTERVFVSIKNTNGNISVESWDKNRIKIIANKETRASNKSDARKMMDELKIKVEVVENSINITTIFPSDNSKSGGFFSWLFGAGGGESSVSYTVVVPKNIDINLLTTNGNIQINNCNGKMRLETINGNIHSEDISGAVHCRSINGSLKIEFTKTDINEDMSFETTNGGINIYLPATINASVAARTINGSVTCDIPLKEVYEKCDTKLKAVLNDGGSYIEIKTINGNIVINGN